MSTSSGILNTSVLRKIAMAASGFFLLIFLLQHFVINFSSVISANTFNEFSHFMGTNPIIQFAMQPVLIFGVVFHLGMGIVLDMKNKSARSVKYAMDKPGENSSWMSRNMVITGIMIMLFLGLHFYDFWIPEIKTKFIDGDFSGMTASGEFRYFHELQHKFEEPVRVGLYCLAFVFLGLHLMHGFQSAFQSVGFRSNKYTPLIKMLGNIYAIVIPAGFIFIAIFHHLAH